MAPAGETLHCSLMVEKCQHPDSRLNLDVVAQPNAGKGLCGLRNLSGGEISSNL